MNWGGGGNRESAARVIPSYLEGNPSSDSDPISGGAFQDHLERLSRLDIRAAQRATSQLPGIASVVAHHKACTQLPGLMVVPTPTLLKPRTAALFERISGDWDWRSDVAILAAAGPGNIDGEPIQGSLALFMAREVDLLRFRKAVLCRHYNWNPPVTSPTDIEPIREALGRNTRANGNGLFGGLSHPHLDC